MPNSIPREKPLAGPKLWRGLYTRRMTQLNSSHTRLVPGLALLAVLAACVHQDQGALPVPAIDHAPPKLDPTTRALRDRVKTIVVIFAENRAFDSLYGNFPGAAGVDEVVDRQGHPLPGYSPQRDRDGSVLQSL